MELGSKSLLRSSMCLLCAYCG